MKLKCIFDIHNFTNWIDEKIEMNRRDTNTTYIKLIQRRRCKDCNLIYTKDYHSC